MVFQKEVCYALLGYTGRVVIERDDGFELAPGLPLVCESEYKLVRRLVELGYFYSRLERYVSDKLYQGYLSKKHSAYIRAFAMGLEESLTPYRARVLQLEQQLIPLAVGLFRLRTLQPALAALQDQLKKDVVRLVKRRTQASFPPKTDAHALGHARDACPARVLDRYQCSRSRHERRCRPVGGACSLR